MIRVPPNARYEIIREVMQKDGNRLNISWLCEAAGVSRSGYYHYIETEDLRNIREVKDREDFGLILRPTVTGVTRRARGAYT
jgi:hypothetical protein